MKRRSTRAEVLLAEAAQAEVIGLLSSLGENSAAHRLAACQAARIWRSASMHRYRCRSAGCVACWNGSLVEWWYGYRDWAQKDASTFAVTLAVDYRLVGPIARALRDMRDRQAQSDPTWADVAFLGITDGCSTAYVMVSPWSVPPDAIMAGLRRRWPSVTPLDASRISPPAVTPRVRAFLATRRRASAPLRFSIFPQAQHQHTDGLEPVPFLVATRPLPCHWAVVERP